MLKITTTELFNELANRLNLSDGKEKHLEEVISQLDGHVIVKDDPELSIEDMGKLEYACMPAVCFLREKCNPHTEIHITDSEIKLIAGKCGIPLK